MLKRCNTILKFCFGFRSKPHINIKQTFRRSVADSGVCEPPWRVLFFGNDKFSLESLKRLCAKLRTGTLMSSLGVVTRNESVVFNYGKSENLTLYDWPINVCEIRGLYDVGMVVSFGKLIPKKVIDELPLGCINIHASLLPRWRGAAPIIHAIIAGDTETGVTIMRIHPHKFDVGEIVRQYRIPINFDETAVDLEKKLATYGSQLLIECLRDLKNSLDMAVTQPLTGITYAPKVTPVMATIDWTTADAKSIFNLHRALSHLYFLKTTWHGTVVRFRNIILDPNFMKVPQLISEHGCDKNLSKSAANFLNSYTTDVPESKKISISVKSEGGKCLYDKNLKLLKVVCVDGQCIIVDALQVGSKQLNAVDFFNGFLSKRKASEWKFT